MTKTTDRKIAAQTPRRLTFTRRKCVEIGVEYYHVDKTEHEDILIEITIERYMAGANDIRVLKSRNNKGWMIQISKANSCRWEMWKDGFDSLWEAMYAADFDLNPNRISCLEPEHSWDAMREHFGQQSRQGLKKSNIYSIK